MRLRYIYGVVAACNSVGKHAGWIPTSVAHVTKLSQWNSTEPDFVSGIKILPRNFGPRLLLLHYSHSALSHLQKQLELQALVPGAPLQRKRTWRKQ